MFRMYDVQLRHAETRRGERALGFLWVFSLPPLFFLSIYETMQKEVGPQHRKGNKHLHRCLELRGSVPTRRHSGVPLLRGTAAGQQIHLHLQRGCRFTGNLGKLLEQRNSQSRSKRVGNPAVDQTKI